MKIEHIAAKLRPRGGWEAVDLGFSLTRAWWRPVLAAWLLVSLPVALALYLLLWDAPWIATLAVWWLKPLLDRAPLAVMSRRLFGERVGPRELLLGLPRLIGSGVFAALTWRRASPWRSFSMPVDQLERLRGGERRARTALLLREHSGPGMGLTLFCSTCELCLTLSLLAFITTLLAGPLGVDLTELMFADQVPVWLPFLLGGLQLVAMTLMEPFFVGGGFALYLNRRVELEGWDIELAFRRLARRLERRRARASGLSVAAALLLLLAPASAWSASEDALSPSRVEQPEEGARGSSEFKATIAEVLAGPEFERTREISTWRPTEQSAPERADWNPEIMAQIAQLLARLLMWLMVAGAVSFLLYVALIAARRLRAREPRRTRDARAVPEVLFGLDLRPESLPADIVTAARAAWEEGRAREALSLLYRGALAHMVHRRELEIQESATEGECEQLVARALGAPLSEDFSALVRMWQVTAYGHATPAGEKFSALCARWRPHLEERA